MSKEKPQDGFKEAKQRIGEALKQRATQLTLLGLELTELPDSLGQLSLLRELVLSHNRLVSLPEWIGRMTRLQTLFLSYNQLTSLPESFGQLTQLQMLRLDNNQLTNLPESIGQLRLLQVLLLYYNQLTSVPEKIGQLTLLRMLDLSHNQLTSLPESLGRLVQLEGLILSNNKLKSLQESLCSLAERGVLKELYLHKNNDLGIPLEILGPGFNQVFAAKNVELDKDKRLLPKDPKRIARYLRQLIVGETRTLDEAKLLVVGPGGHGKSSLIEFLRTQQFEKGKKSTEGVDVIRWPIPGGQLRLNIWDFGGQEIQHSTHEFFLTQRCVYLLVFQPRDDMATTQGLYYWLDLIHLVAPEAPVIIALSKQDELKGHVSDEADLRKLHPKIVGDFIRISCESTNECVKNVPMLLQRIKETVTKEVGHVRYKLPATWMAVKTDLENKHRDYMSYAVYRELCEKHGITESEDQKILADLLHELGTMLNYSDRMPLEETHILNPGWVTEGVYAVVISEVLRSANGVLDEDMLCTLLGDPKRRGKYPKEAQRFILQMMLTFRLCYELPSGGTGRHYLVPNALPENEPKIDHDWSGALRFEIHFPRILPSSIMSRFIVAMHGQHEKAKLGRLGMFSKMHEHEFHVSAHPKERKIRIFVAGLGPMRARVLEVIRQHFAVICREQQGLEPKEFTFPPKHPDAEPFSFEKLMEAERAGKEEIWIGGQVGDTNVREWLDGVTIPEERAKLQKMILRLEGKESRSINYLHIEHLEKLDVAMGDKHESKIIFSKSPVTGSSIASGAGRTVSQKQDSFTRMLQQVADPELRKHLGELQDVIAVLRRKEADQDDCDIAEEAMNELVAVAVEPKKEESPKKVKGALAKLKGLTEGFKNVVEVGEKFETVVKWLSPVISKIVAEALKNLG